MAPDRLTMGDGVVLEVRRWHGDGAKLPILLLHEGLGSISMWRSFPERLSQAVGRTVVAYSRPGHGGSDPIPEPRGPDYMHREAAQTPEVMTALGIDRAHLLGHSDGGSIALIIAAAAPDRVASLILEAPHVYVEQLTVDSIAQIRTTYLASDLGAKLGRHHNDADHIFWRWNDIWLDPRFRDWSIESLLESVEAPALLIQGLDDEYGTLDQLDRIARGLQRTLRLELAACGHSPHRDQPEAVLQAVRDFLKGQR